MPMTKAQRQRRYLDKLYAKARKADALEPLVQEILGWRLASRPELGALSASELQQAQNRIRQVLEAEQ